LDGAHRVSNDTPCPQPSLAGRARQSIAGPFRGRIVDDAKPPLHPRGGGGIQWFDSHCHLDAIETLAERDAEVQRARENGVANFLNLPGHVDHFAQAIATRERYGCATGLGIHPMWVAGPGGFSKREHVEMLRDQVKQHKPEIIGEIGLDFFIEHPNVEEQTWFYIEQLKIARDFDLPVALHVRKSQDTLLKYLRRIPVRGGFAHAFNGSPQQAQAFIDLGFKLGFGGSATFPNAIRIRHLLQTIPEHAIVVETDAPDIPPSFLGTMGSGARNSIAHLPRIGEILAHVRGMPPAQFAELTTRNALDILNAHAL
jgi:TatD DNase family protein